MTPVRVIWFLVGFTALSLGVVGAVLPFLPTTPFLLLAAFAFARSSKRWHAWLLQHRIFGPLIRDWQNHGAISVKTKIVSVITMAAVLVLSLILQASLRVIVIQAIVLSCAALFVVSRPSPPKI